MSIRIVRQKLSRSSRWLQHWILVALQAAGVQLALVATTAACADDYDPFSQDPWPSTPVVSSRDPFDDAKVKSAPVARPSSPVNPFAGQTTQSAAPAPAATTAKMIALPPTAQTTRAPVVRTAFTPYQFEQLPQPAALPPAKTAQVSPIPPVGCGIPNERPIGQLTINIDIPKGELPMDQAAACWQQLNATGGPLAGVRMWPQQAYNWDATCFASQPLYFEEVNLERYGYGCTTCLQSAYSAAHFFATVPALPYCVAVDCPGECKYTLGHYRPGSCPPWRFHRPPCSGLGGISEAGVLTGFIFLIP